MIFHTFGDKNNKAAVFIHGVLDPWQIWQPYIDHFSKEYYVIVPALDGHTEEGPSEFISLEDEAEKIESFIAENAGGKVYALTGLSMGGAIAAVIWKNGRTEIDNLVLDGAPLASIPSIAVKLMTKSYISVINKSKQRDEKTLAAFRRDFLPEQYLEPFLKFADTMTEQTVKNMLSSVWKNRVYENIPGNTRILFMHGTKGNESVAASSAKKLKKLYPAAREISFPGLKHCELAIYSPGKWIDTVTDFLQGE